MGAALQVPTTSLLTPLRRIWVLTGAIALWGVGFALLWVFESIRVKRPPGAEGASPELSADPS